MNCCPAIERTAFVADDTTVFIEDISSGNVLFTLLGLFEKWSGLGLNKEKTEAMWLGVWRDRTDTPLPVLWPNNPILCLGINFSYDQKLCEEINNLHKTLNIWKSRDLTLIGKITILKSLGLSKLIYNSCVLMIPPRFAVEVNKAIEYRSVTSRKQ